MQFSKLSLFAVAAPVFGQNLLNDLPPDLESYIGSVETNPAVVQAIVPLITATPIVELLDNVLSGNGAGDATGFAMSLQVAASEAIANEPDDRKSIASSVIGVVESLAQTDNFVASVSNKISSYVTGSATHAATTGAMTTGSMSGSMSMTGSMMMTATTGGAASSGAAANSASSSGQAQTHNAAAQPTGMALGAMVGAVAAVAMIL